MSLLVAEALSHTYGSGDLAIPALHEIDLGIQPGEVTLLTGPSGSGKTTLIQIMGCLLRPSAGRVMLDGHDISRESEKKRNRTRRENFGFIFQANNLFPMLTAIENVMVALDVVGRETKARAKERAAELLAAVGLGERLTAFPANMSGGQRQRVGIARALAGDPRIILADEPTAALDALNGHRVVTLLRDLAHEKGRAVVIVTHDPRIEDLADRIVHIEDGQIAVDGRKNGT
ncbi:MAG: ABC transporter ATP-binding protein [Gammaproteobacteria bacterium]|nr:ABC transporter ATP-binding protein [Gammaproteobacteria bacterium]MBI5618447.1 ABC transporter ATP-binding protein [Gammaproteobacteria bacterium]